MKLSQRTWTILRRVVLYPTYFCVCSIVFAYCTFPYDRVRDRVEAEVERAMPGADLEIVSLSPSWVTGIALTGVSLTLPPEPGEEVPSEISLTEARARVGLLALLTGGVSISFSAELGGGGTIEGAVENGETSSHVVLHLERVALERIGPLRRFAKLPLAGTLAGDVDVTIADDVEATNGSATLSIAGLAIGDGTARLQIPGLRSGITVERLDAGNLDLRVQIERGVGRLQQLSASSDDIELRGAGTLRLLRPIRMSNIDLMLRLDVKPPYRERNDRTRAIFTMVEMAQEVRPFRAPDGAFQVRLAGSFGSSIRALPAGTAPMPQ